MSVEKKVRPYVLKKLRFEVFCSLHNLSHPGIRATKCLIQDRFIWTSMLKDITCTMLHSMPTIESPEAYSSYQGPFDVLSRTDDHFIIKRNDRTTTVSIDWLKPAFRLNDTNSTREPFPEHKRDSPVVYAPRLDSGVPMTLSGRKFKFKPKFLRLLINFRCLQIMHGQQYECDLDFKKMEIHVLPSPQQHNAYDCGVYLLKNVEMFFKNTSLFNVPVPDVHNWFNAEDVIAARKEIYATICRLR
ncbi:hypothetical protein NPIL_534741 [Nephila pilipes]|uniref:Ubiquitin-like protease family profile domain-containing protein n=1 Tax=Nephila pilipes TaxID=299642 RepID=A0A8X6PQW5_NEPPI|nr:hypothetical protein NPIL_534741 [Nephila pilipes]